MMGVSKKPQQGKLDNIYNRIKMTREFTRSGCRQLKLLRASRLLYSFSASGHLRCLHVLAIVNRAALGRGEWDGLGEEA